MEAVIICILQSNKCFRRVTKFLGWADDIKLSSHQVKSSTIIIIPTPLCMDKQCFERLDRGLVWYLALKGKVLFPGGRDLGRFSRLLRFWEGLVIYITR